VGTRSWTLVLEGQEGTKNAYKNQRGRHWIGGKSRGMVSSLYRLVNVVEGDSPPRRFKGRETGAIPALRNHGRTSQKRKSRKDERP